jgi:nucleoid-associated protein Lsr2
VAQKVSVSYACDYDQKVIPDGEHRVREFSFDGRHFEIDLCQQHGDAFDETISRYAKYARMSSVPPGQPAKRRTAAHRQHSASVRAWAKQAGIEVSDRGRIPAEVVARYDAAHR